MAENNIKEETGSRVSETRLRLDLFEQDEDCDQFSDFDEQNWNLNIQNNNANSTIPKIENISVKSVQMNALPCFPSYSDIQKSIQIIRKVFPETFTDQVIDSLFQNLMQKMSNPFKKFTSPTVKVKGRAKYAKDTVSQKINYTMRPKKKPNQAEFIQIFHPQISQKKQKANSATTFPIVNCNNRKFEDHPMVQNPQKGIAARLDKIWTQQYQQLLLNLYRKGNQFSFIRDHFQQEYPQHHSNFSVNSLRGRFYKVIRQTIRKLHVFIDKIGREFFPKMIKLSYNLIQKVMYFQEGRALRYLLVDLYFCDRLNKTLVDRIIEGFHQFIADTRDKEHTQRNVEDD